MAEVVRYDLSTGEALTSKAVIKEDGSIEARAILTSIGVFPYRRSDGTIQRELRTPEAVFDTAFVESTKNMPIYIGHKYTPDGKLIKDPTLIAELSVGRTDNAPVGDNVYLSNVIHVTRADGIQAVNSGMQSLSVGYVCDMVQEAGIWCGQEYDAVQTNLRGDHLALVFAGRQGDQAVLRMDSSDAEMVDNATVVANNTDTNKEDVMAENLKTVKFDGIEYSAEETVLVKLNEAQTRADSLQVKLDTTVAEKSTVEAERDSLKERFDASDKKVKELEAARIDEAMIEARVAKRLDILAVAQKAEVEVKADMAEADIVVAVIKKAFPACDLTGKDAAYVSARFDCAREVLTAVTDESVRAAGGGELHSDSANGNLESEARARMLKERAEQYKIKDKE
jgi:hypothetical protein